MKVLVAEDDPVTLHMLEATLQKWGYEVIAVRDGKQAEEVLLAGETRLAICDWMLPELSGPELCRRIRQAEGGSFLYVIILSARDSKEDIIEGLTAGADDYVTKPFDAQELEVRVRAGQRLLDLQQDLLDAQERLTQMATHDGLTGMMNHQAILETLEREFARHMRQHSSIATAMVDLDHFKQVNDTWGHVVGDTVLAEVASRLGKAVRPYDSVGRYGGEEFLLILPGCDGDSAHKIAERIRLAVGDRSIATSAGPVKVSISIGVAASADLPAVSAISLVREADTALYRAKERGRNCVVRASSQPAAPVDSSRSPYRR
ncbi:MAG: GGDEF domain-containing response regulator [Planctomycetota bacterium]|jgi:diguanylate cyclase (GGDEF)-like protein